jgi:hypothetical protein
MSLRAKRKPHPQGHADNGGKIKRVDVEIWIVNRVWHTTYATPGGKPPRVASELRDVHQRGLLLR